MDPDQIRLDDPDDEVLPASPARRRRAAFVGCFTLLFLLGALTWFVATHTQTFENPGLFGS